MSLKPVTYGMVYQGRRQKRNYPAVKIRVDIFKDEPGIFSRLVKIFQVRPQKNPHVFLRPDNFFFDGGCYGGGPFFRQYGIDFHDAGVTQR